MDQVDQGGFTANPFTQKSDLAMVAKTMSFSSYQPVLPPSTAAIFSTVVFKECLKNHAASLGGHALDGCGEFMPSSVEIRDQGSMKCAACGCHRNFHRQETAKRRRDTALHPPVNPSTAGITPPHFSLLPRRFASSPSTSPSPSPSPPRQMNPPPPPPPPSAAGSIQQYSPGPHMLMALSTGKGTSPPPPSDHHPRQMNHHHHQTRRNQNPNPRSSHPSPISNGSASKRKRFRSKFSSEQKEKMRRFAEQLNWKMQRNDEKLVSEFCADVGVSQGVLKVWMHNNKNTIGKIPKNSNNNNNSSNHSSSNNLEDEEEEHELDQQLHLRGNSEDHHQINHELGLIRNHHHLVNDGSSCSA